MNGWNQEEYHLMLWTQNNPQAHSLTFHLHCKSASLFSNVQFPCDDAWKKRQIIKVIQLWPSNWWYNSKTQLDRQQSNKLPCFLFCFVLSFFYGHSGINNYYFHQPMSPISFLVIHCIGETTFSVRKVSGKGVAKTIVWWLTRTVYVLFLM